jgi:hypothetical protein
MKKPSPALVKQLAKEYPKGVMLQEAKLPKGAAVATSKKPTKVKAK